MKKRITIQRLIHASRWLLAPMYLGLIIILVLYMIQFCSDVYIICAQAIMNRHIDKEQTSSVTLNLIDIGMVGGLLYMVCYSGWETYIEKLRNDQGEQPGWLGRGSLGPIGQKFKLMAAMATISGIKLLEMSQKMTKENIAVTDALIRVHLAYVVTALVFYYMSKHENDEHRKGSEGASKVDA